MEKMELIENSGRIDLIGLPKSSEIKNFDVAYFYTKFKIKGYSIDFYFQMNDSYTERYFKRTKTYPYENNYSYTLATPRNAVRFPVTDARDSFSLLDYEVLKKAIELYNKYVEEINNNIISLKVNCTFEIALEDENIVKIFKENHPATRLIKYKDQIKEAVSKNLGIDFDKIKIDEESGLQSISSKYDYGIINYS